MKIIISIFFTVITLISFSQQKLPKVQVEVIKEISDDAFIRDPAFIEEIYSYLIMNFDSTETKQNIVFSDQIEGICSFNQQFKNIHYQLNLCKLPSEKEVIVEFQNFSHNSIREFVEQIVKIYDIDEVNFKWNQEKTKYDANFKGIDFHFELTVNSSSITLRHYFKYL